MKERVIQFVLSSLPEAESERLDSLSQSIADSLLPSLAETSEVSCAELAAKTLVELAYIVGFTHRPEHSLTLMAAVSEAMRAGMQDYCDENIEAISADIAGDGDDLAVDLDEAEQRHQSIH